ncbi:MAG TPA: hypothetical protein VE077_22315 [Candidatus Methylomirabilis sp.]|nr:hypothetical protein [Candidatus Methylomirabilis sp.]
MKTRKHNSVCIAWALLFPALLACFPAATLAADEITGHVHNGTRGGPAAGDEVTLLRLEEHIAEEARTTTDSQGAFELELEFPNKPHLVRVIHQGVNYDQPVSRDEAVSMDIFDAADTIDGISGSIEIIRAGTKGNLLHVSDMYEIRNDSNPPLTLAGKRTFDVYLPAEAEIDSVFAAAPGKIGEMITATAGGDEPGHYAVNFPLRPGATKFAFNYDVPYAGHAAFRTRRAYAVLQLAVMVPPSMRFSSSSRAFQILAAGNPRYQVRVASQLTAGEGPVFEISGAGALPQPEAANPPARPEHSALPNVAAGAQGSSDGAVVQSAQSGADLRSRSQADAGSVRSRRSSETILLRGVSVCLIVTCALLIWRSRRRAS